MAADAHRLINKYKFPFQGIPHTVPERARYHSGNVKLIEVLVNQFDTLKAGDLLYFAAPYARPAQALTWDTNLATTQATFANTFLGVCWEDLAASAGNRSVIVDISGESVYKFPLKVASVFPLRQRFGPAQSGGNELIADKLAEVAAATSAIAQAMKANDEAGDDEAYVSFASFMNMHNINSDLG